MHLKHCSIEGGRALHVMPLPFLLYYLLLGTGMGLFFAPRFEIMQSDGVDYCSQVKTAWGI